MNVTLEIPDELGRRLLAVAPDLPRRALEALGLEEFQSGHLTETELQNLLGLQSPEMVRSLIRRAVNRFSSAHGAAIRERSDLAETCRAQSRAIARSDPAGDEAQEFIDSIYEWPED